DGKQALSCCGWPPESQDRSIRIWDVDSGKELRRLVGHTDCVWRIALSPDDALLASASRDGTLRLGDRKPGEEGGRFEVHGGWGLRPRRAPHRVLELGSDYPAVGRQERQGSPPVQGSPHLTRWPRVHPGRTASAWRGRE